MKGNNILQSVSLANFPDDSELTQVENANEVILKQNNSPNGQQIVFAVDKDQADYTQLKISRRNLKTTDIPRDCVDLHIGQMHWFGGPQHRKQFWPIEKASYKDYSYLTKEQDNVGVAERYWLNSKGVFIYVEDTTPLFIEQNVENAENKLCFVAKKALPYSTHTSAFTFSYKIGIGQNAKQAHLKAVENILKKPSNHPNENMVRYPIWSTWALYKAEVNESRVREFSNNVIANGFSKYSQIEIDDDWEECYGALKFRASDKNGGEKFPNIKQLTSDLKAQGFRVTLWIHPFINNNCTAYFNEAKEKGYLVLDHNQSPATQWWNSIPKDAALIDFTNPNAVEWFSQRLKRLQTEDGIDSFKFDAGESSWAPSDPILIGDEEFKPSVLTREYVKAVSKFGDLVEVRSGQGTQNLPIFLRMIDKDSEWGWDNGLPTLVTTLIQLNMAGYPFILPDMIGGNGYNNHPPDKELFLRWLQANVFMPSLQFSYVPWNFDDETIALSRFFTNLHDAYSTYIMGVFKNAIETGEPVNRPLWWVDPADIVAQGIYDRKYLSFRGMKSFIFSGFQSICWETKF